MRWPLPSSPGMHAVQTLSPSVVPGPDQAGPRFTLHLVQSASVHVRRQSHSQLGDRCVPSKSMHLQLCMWKFSFFFFFSRAISHTIFDVSFSLLKLLSLLVQKCVII